MLKAPSASIQKRERFMSTVAEILESAQGGRLVQNLAQQFGLSEEQTKTAVGALAPALAAGLRNAARDPDTFQKLVADVAHPAHVAAFADPAAGGSEEAGSLGQEAIANLFGSGSAAGQMAQVAARDTGLRPDVLTRLLPTLAAIVLGGLFKSFGNQGLGPILGQLAEAGGLGSVLGQLGRSAPRPTQSAGGLGGLLGAVLGMLLGGKPSASAQSSGGSASTFPGGLDPATLEAALEQIKKTLNASGGASSPSSQDAELQDVLDKVFPK
jgi:hypothetical protein